MKYRVAIGPRGEHAEVLRIIKETGLVTLVPGGKMCGSILPGTEPVDFKNDPYWPNRVIGAYGEHYVRIDSYSGAAAQLYSATERDIRWVVARERAIPTSALKTRDAEDLDPPF
jgi:hypothetical protein